MCNIFSDCSILAFFAMWILIFEYMVKKLIQIEDLINKNAID